MKQILAIAWREYRVRVSSPMYIGLTVITFIFLVGVPIIASTMLAAEALKPVEIRVVDKTNWLLPLLKIELKSSEHPLKNTAAALVNLQLSAVAVDKYQALLDEANEGTIVGVLLLEGRDLDQLTATFSSSSSITISQVKSVLEPALSKLIYIEKLKKLQIEPKIAVALLSPVEANYIQLTTGESSDDYDARIMIAGLFNILMYSAILMYSTMTFQGVLEEKSSRVMEVIVSAVKPEKLIAGKVLGIGLLGLTQMLIWTLPYLLLTTLPLGQLSESLNQIDGVIFGYMLVYFILGFFFYGSLYAAGASTISRIEDSQAVTTPLTMFVISGYIVAIFAIANPVSEFAVITSQIPFFAPMVMFTRLALSEPPSWQIVLSIGILSLTMLVTMWLSGRVYRVGVLRYGAKPTLRTIGNYIRGTSLSAKVNSDAKL